MPIKGGKELPKGGLETQLEDGEMRAELELISELYAKYLAIPLTAATELSDSAFEQYERELQIVKNILNSGNSVEPLLIHNQQEILRKMLRPKIGQRRLPDLFNGDGIAQTNRLVSVSDWFDVWRQSDFDIYLQLEIAQCRALIIYRHKLEQTIQQLQANNHKEQLDVKAFNWVSDKSKIQKLFRKLSESGIIDCSQGDFSLCFGGDIIDASTHKIKWLLTSKNGEVSKASLFYFIHLLRDSKLLTSPHENFQNKTIERLFTDAKGNQLKNLKQSKANSPKGADQMLLAEIVRSIS